MKRITITLLMAVIASNVCFSANNDKEVDSLKIEIRELSTTQKSILNELEKLRRNSKGQESQIIVLTDKDVDLSKQADSLNSRLQELTSIQNSDRTSFQDSIQAVNGIVNANLGKMDTRTIWGGGLLVLIVLGFGSYLFVRRRSDSSSMDDVRKAQDALRAAQERMQEDSVKLDNQMLMLVEKQMNATPAVTTATTATDHALALKVADEIVRIELNLSRMDSSVKGYKQLSKAVERIKNNFQANGYEIVDMLGKPYNEGMKVVANFVPDENLKEGEQVITGVTKPQINYNGKMIQSAQITVSQNI